MPTATAEVISIGDEMTSGARLDTNSQWLSQRLAELGVSVRFQSTVGDRLEDNIEVFRIATSRADLVIASGGLGPTADDLTRDALAALTARPLVQSDSALAHIAAMFSRRGRPMPPRNQVQALFPQGALEIFNPRGTAPGIDLLVPRGDDAQPSRFFALPGVPAEMKEMFIQTVVPRIIAHTGKQRSVLKQRVIKCFGLGESDMEAKLGEMISRSRFPRVGITVSAATISLRIAAEASSEMQCDEMIARTREEIMAKVGPYVFGEGEDFELHNALAMTLARRQQRIATLELGHAAPLAGWLADVVPREVYAGGTIAAAGLLGDAWSPTLPNELPQRTAEAAPATGDADHWRQKLAASGADWILAIDHYPSLRSSDDIVADFTLTLCGRQREQFWQQAVQMGGHPAILHARIGKTALAFANSLLKTLGTHGEA